jgi:hypothetical protein
MTEDQQLGVVIDMASTSQGRGLRIDLRDKLKIAGTTPSGAGSAEKTTAVYVVDDSGSIAAIQCPPEGVIEPFKADDGRLGITNAGTVPFTMHWEYLENEDSESQLNLNRSSLSASSHRRPANSGHESASQLFALNAGNLNARMQQALSPVSPTVPTRPERRREPEAVVPALPVPPAGVEGRGARREAERLAREVLREQQREAERAAWFMRRWEGRRGRSFIVQPGESVVIDVATGGPTVSINVSIRVIVQTIWFGG